ncbi:proline racemase family protein [Paenibacillus sp. JJ-223]|uniref:proline racemase family protein n=1 Tax=Paenibacillus sp. JJ-223 TaxID=2905647 RepID=UPI001F29A175|nr:proline racemase family protein [Paenibacillus sp. JJ-223]CAH1191514.1 Trans-3-hydroxy-L-proline dehydratase [Paenibacillus sp. JJ-223]
METTKWYAALDTHSCGQPLRIITGGLPQISGSSQYEKSLFFKRHFDSVRKLLLAEPRGHREMTGAIVTAPTTEEASFGLLFLNQAGLSAISGHGIIAAVAAWTSTGQLSPSEAAKGILIDCPAGTVKAFADCDGHEVRSVSFWNVPSFVYAEQLAVKVQGMEARVDVAFGGEFYAVVDTSMWETGDVFALPKLREWGRLIREEIERQLEVRHPQLDWITGINGVFFYQRHDATGDDGHPNRLAYRCAAALAGEQLDRSPGGAAACAHMAVLHARCPLEPGQQVIYEGITGAQIVGSIASETETHGYHAVIPSLTGTAHILGFMNFLLDPSDPLPEGFVLY